MALNEASWTLEYIHSMHFASIKLCLGEYV